jgi:hypothetical protein
MSFIVVSVLRVERVRPAADATCALCEVAFVPRHHASRIVYVLDGDERQRVLHHRCVGPFARKWRDAGWGVTARDGARVPGVTTC